MTSVLWHDDQSLPDFAFRWLDGDGVPVDFTSGWSFEARFRDVLTGTTARTVPAEQISTAVADPDDPNDPNVVVGVLAADRDALTVGARYELRLYAIRSADSKRDLFEPIPSVFRVH